jgi:hypothetical protein
MENTVSDNIDALLPLSVSEVEDDEKGSKIELRPKLEDIPNLQRREDAGNKSSSLLQLDKPTSVKGSVSIVLLYKNIKARDWEEVMRNLDKNENIAKNWIEEVNPDGSLRWRSLPIHLVSYHGCECLLLFYNT